jgi:hypothetical protein
MISVHVSQEFKVTRPDGALYPAGEFHQLAGRLMERDPDLADSTTSSDASLGIVTVEVLVSAEDETAATARFGAVVDRLAELREAAAERVRTMPMFDDHPDDIRQRDEEREAWLALQAQTDPFSRLHDQDI